MDPSSVSDASEWNVPQLRYFEGFLRCGICRDFYNVPVTLRAFCSLCIRQHFSLCQECPSCRRIYSDSVDLDPNHTVDEIVSAFKCIRRTLMQTLSESKETCKPNTIALEQGQCPICNLFVDISKVEAHVDSCLEKQRLESGAKSQRQPISKPVFALMKDAQLKKTLTDFGLPTTGERSVLIKRISDYVNLYNVECDARRPKSLDRIRAIVLENEKAQNRASKRDLKSAEYDDKSKSQMLELLSRAKKVKEDLSNKQ